MSGDTEAQTVLYRTYFDNEGAVYYWVYKKSYWIPERDKPDILNDIFIAVMDSLKNFEFKSSLKTYIVRIAKIKCLDAMPARLGVSKGRGIRFVDIHQCKDDGEPEVQIEDSYRKNHPEDFFDRLEEEEQVYLLYKSLIYFTGPRCRKILKLYIQELHEEISRDDLADHLGVSVERASQMIYDCLYRLRKKIRDNFRDYQAFADYIYDRELGKTRVSPRNHHLRGTS